MTSTKKQKDKAPAKPASTGKRKAKPTKNGSAKDGSQRGRPTLFKPEMYDQARDRCMLGATNPELADFLGVDLETIKRWIREDDKFRTAVWEGRDGADARVAKSLYHRATGYSHPDTHTSSYLGDITETPITKHYPPDVTAATWWLKNRRPDLWRDRQELTGADGAPIQIAGIEWNIVRPKQD